MSKDKLSLGITQGLVFSVILFLLLLPMITYVFVLEQNAATEPQLDSTLKVMTYNLHYGIGMDNVFDPNRIADFVASKDIDIVGFQELSHDFILNAGGDFASLLTMAMEKRGYKYHAFSNRHNGGLFNGIFSKYPIIYSESFVLEPKIVLYRTLVHATIKINNTYFIDFYTTHLSHIYEDKSNPERVKQVGYVLNIMKQAKYPTILVGDFNAFPDWPEITTITDQNYIDSWALLNPNNDTATWPANDPELHIDYVFLDPTMNPIQSVIYKTLISDHLPLATTVNL